MTDTQKILITHDRNGAEAFRREVAETADAANSLIRIFEAFQPWQKIATVALFNSLVSDPTKFYDDTLLQNVKVQAVGVKPDPGKLAELVGLHRAEFFNATAGLPLTSDDCAPCRKVQVKPGKRAISKRTFEAYAQYLTFTAGTFTVNQEKVEASMSRYDTYAESPAEIERYTLFTDLVAMLNKFTELYPINPTDRQTIAKSLHLQLTEAIAGSFRLNDEFLKNEIIYIKNMNDGN